MLVQQSHQSTLEGLLLHSCEAESSQDYWNLDDILSEQELIPCSFKDDARGLGYLDQVDSAIKQKNSRVQKMNLDTLKANTKVDLPLWLALALAKREIIELRNPKYLGQSFFDQLKAGCEVVSMKMMNPYLYENVMKLSQQLNEEQAKEAMDLYQKCFIKRFQSLVINLSNNANQTEQFSAEMKRLTILEKEIFDLNKRQRIGFQNWKNQEVKKIEVNHDLINYQKENYKRIKTL